MAYVFCFSSAQPKHTPGRSSKRLHCQHTPACFNEHGHFARCIWLAFLALPRCIGLISWSIGLGAFVSPFSATQFAQRRRWSFHFFGSLAVAVLNTACLLIVFRGKRQERQSECWHPMPNTKVDLSDRLHPRNHAHRDIGPRRKRG